MNILLKRGLAVEEKRFDYKCAPKTDTEIQILREYNNGEVSRWGRRSDYVTSMYLLSAIPVALGISELINRDEPFSRIIILFSSPLVALFLCLAIELAFAPLRYCKRNLRNAQANKEKLEVAELEQVLKLAEMIRVDLLGKYAAIGSYLASVFSVRSPNAMLVGELRFVFSEKNRIDREHEINEKLQKLHEFESHITKKDDVASAL